MRYCIHICICLGLIISQTTFLSDFHLFLRIYDLLVPFVLYLGIYRPIHEGIVMIFFFSFIMDCLSGGPFGLYGTTYVWLFLFTRWVRRFLQVHDRFMLPLVVASGVLAENLIFFITFVFLKTVSKSYLEIFHIVVEQVVLAMLTGVFFLKCFYYIHEILYQWIKELFKEENEDYY